jgi:O-antigen ligase
MSTPMSRWERGVDVWLTASTVFLGCFLLVSTAGTAIALVAMLLGCILQAPRIWRLGLWRDPLILWGLVFFAFVWAHETWMAAAGGPPGDMIGSYAELWRFPIVLAVFAVIRNRDFFWGALITVAVVLAALIWSEALGRPVMPPEFSFPGRRISLGFGLVAVAWVAWTRSFYSGRPWLLRAISVSLVLTLLFAMDGRTAHLLVVLLVAWAGWTRSGPRLRWLLVLLLPALVLAVASMSKSVQNRMADTLSAFSAPPLGSQATSAGLRKEFYLIGLEVALENPWVGVGLSGIPEAYREKIVQKAQKDVRWAPYADPSVQRTSNLHNEYLMLWAGTGTLGLLLFLVWLVLPMFMRGFEGFRRQAMSGLVLAFAVGCCLNSWLLDFTPGHIYMVLMAWLLSERYRTERFEPGLKERLGTA